jgi:hypothetical protein
MAFWQNGGDYAHLDIGRKSFYSYARQAGALLLVAFLFLLICVIPSGAKGQDQTFIRRFEIVEEFIIEKTILTFMDAAHSFIRKTALDDDGFGPLYYPIRDLFCRNYYSAGVGIDVAWINYACKALLVSYRATIWKRGGIDGISCPEGRCNWHSGRQQNEKSKLG